MSTRTTGPLGIAVIGAGYWGPNLVRNFGGVPGLEPRAGLRPRPRPGARASPARTSRSPTASSGCSTTRGSTRSPSPPRPARTTGSRWQALRAGKHVLVEKPLADSVARGRAMVDLADAQGLVLMTDHTYCYTPAVQKMRELVGSGELGQVHFVDSVRINLGLVQPDIDVLWDLAPHDLAILDFVLPGGLPTTGIGAHRRRPDRRRPRLCRPPDPAAAGRRRSRTCTSTG